LSHHKKISTKNIFQNKNFKRSNSGGKKNFSVENYKVLVHKRNQQCFVLTKYEKNLSSLYMGV